MKLLEYNVVYLTLSASGRKLGHMQLIRQWKIRIGFKFMLLTLSKVPVQNLYIITNKWTKQINLESMTMELLKLTNNIMVEGIALLLQLTSQQFPSLAFQSPCLLEQKTD